MKQDISLTNLEHLKLTLMVFLFQEMLQIIAALRQRLPEAELQTADRLSKARRIRRSIDKTRIPIDADRILRRVYRSAFAAARYKTIRFDLHSKSWQKGTREWRA